MIALNDGKSSLLSNYGEKLLVQADCDQYDADEVGQKEDDEANFKSIVSKSQLLARKASFQIASRKQSLISENHKPMSALAPYILSVAIGIHSVLSTT